MRPLAYALVMKECSETHLCLVMRPALSQEPLGLRVMPPVSHKYLCWCHISSSSCPPPSSLPLHALCCTCVSFICLCVQWILSADFHSALSLFRVSHFHFSYFIKAGSLLGVESLILGKSSSAPHLWLDWISEVFEPKLFCILFPSVLFSSSLHHHSKSLVFLLHRDASIPLFHARYRDWYCNLEYLPILMPIRQHYCFFFKYQYFINLITTQYFII